VSTIFEPDGKTLFGFLQKSTTDCRIDYFSGDGDRFAYRMLSTNGDDPSLIGLVGGKLSEGKLKVLRSYPDTTYRDVAAGVPAFVEIDGALNLFDWERGQKLDSILSPDGRPIDNTKFVGDRLFFQTGRLTNQALWTYTTSGKTKLFRSFGEDETRGVADLGTDGRDWVWIEGYDRPVNNRDGYPHARIMTAKVSSDASEPVSRVVREGFAGYPFGTTPWTVGCGYAARFTALYSPTGLRQTIVVVRLSDGATYTLDSEGSSATSFGEAIGLTCDELFLRGTELANGERRYNVFRVRLDSLGPDRLVPLPPDAGN
jgi:hypothetical protein